MSYVQQALSITRCLALRTLGTPGTALSQVTRRQSPSDAARAGGEASNFFFFVVVVETPKTYTKLLSTKFSTHTLCSNLASCQWQKHANHLMMQPIFFHPSLETALFPNQMNQCFPHFFLLLFSFTLLSRVFHNHAPITLINISLFCHYRMALEHTNAPNTKCRAASAVALFISCMCMRIYYNLRSYRPCSTYISSKGLHTILHRMTDQHSQNPHFLFSVLCFLLCHLSSHPLNRCTTDALHRKHYTANVCCLST